MVNLVLDDLRRPAGKGLKPCLKFLVLPLYFDCLKTLCLPCAGEGQAPFLGFIGIGLLDDDGIEHDHVLAIIVKGNDAFIDANHIRRHAYAAILMSNEGVQQILCHAEIIHRGGGSLLGEKSLVFKDFTDHMDSPARLCSSCI